MIIIGVDFHPEFQQIASVDTNTGEFQEKRLAHPEEAEKFYRDLAAAGHKVRVGMEASGHARWFERLLAELQFELWIGDAAEIRTKRVRKQKTDRQDAQLILRLLVEDRFPQIWVPSWENRDLRQLLWHPPNRRSTSRLRQSPYRTTRTGVKLLNSLLPTCTGRRKLSKAGQFELPYGLSPASVRTPPTSSISQAPLCLLVKQVPSDLARESARF